MYKAIRISDTVFKTLVVLAVIAGIVLFLDKAFAQSSDDVESLDPTHLTTPTPRDPNFCFTCSMVITYANLANEYVQKLSDAILPGMRIMFASLVGLWIVLQGYKILFGMSQPQQLYTEFIYVAIGFIFLNHVGADLVNDVYQASLAVMSGASSIAFIPAGTPETSPTGIISTIDVEEYKNLISLIFTTEKAVFKVIDLASSLITNAGTWDTPIAIFYAIILALPYFFVMVVFFAQVTIAIFRLMMLSAFSPFLMMCYAFGWGRGMAQSAIKTLISSIAVMFAVTASIAMVVYAVNKMNVSGLNTTLSMTNPGLVILILLGYLSAALMTEAVGIANSITGSALSNTAVGTFTAGATATGAGILAQRHRVNPLAWGRGYTGMKGSVGSGAEGLGQMGRDAGTLYDKVKSVSRGGGGS